METIDQIKAKMKTAIEHLKTKLKGIRTGRANPVMLDGVMVEVYGSLVRLKELASVSVPEARQLLISPFDPKNAPHIAKSIEKANMGLNPIVDGNSVRIKVPPMDEAMRKEMVKLCHKEREDAKVSIRNIRRDANDHAKREKAQGNIPEDLLKKLEKQIQDATDLFCKEADAATKLKEDEVMHV